MGFLDKLFGRSGGTERPQQQGGYQDYGQAHAGQGYAQPSTTQPSTTQQMTDEQALARYRYLLRTAPPETIEQTHADAFAQLTPDQRQQVLAQLSQDLPAGEVPRSDDPREMAQAATRAELRQPGYLQSSLGGMSRGGGRGGAMAAGFGGSMLGTVAGVVVGSMLANAIFDGYGGSPEAQEAGDSGEGLGSDAGEQGALPDEGGDAGSGDAGGDAGAADTGVADAGYDASGGGDVGGDFGGGSDFGGGDFGGGFDF